MHVVHGCPEYEYCPEEQATHDVEPSTLDVPAAQLTHVASEVARILIEYVPCLHLLHEALPGLSEKVPAGHGEHVVCPARENVPRGQSTGGTAGFSHVFPAGHIELPAPSPSEKYPRILLMNEPAPAAE